MLDESPNKALESVVKSLGGTKQVAPLLWPDKSIEDARRLLCDCLSDDRPAKLDFSQVLFILRLARSRGIHGGMAYIAAELGYAEPQPIEPRDELAELLRQNLEAHRESQRRQERIERLMTPALRSAA